MRSKRVIMMLVCLVLLGCIDAKPDSSKMKSQVQNFISKQTKQNIITVKRIDFVSGEFEAKTGRYVGEFTITLEFNKNLKLLKDDFMLESNLKRSPVLVNETTRGMFKIGDTLSLQLPFAFYKTSIGWLPVSHG